MQQVTNLKELENAISINGEMIVGKKNNAVIVMSIDEYKQKLSDGDIERKLIKADKQIKESKTVKASEVFNELEELYGF